MTKTSWALQQLHLEELYAVHVQHPKYQYDDLLNFPACQVGQPFVLIHWLVKMLMPEIQSSNKIFIVFRSLTRYRQPPLIIEIASPIPIYIWWCSSQISLHETLVREIYCFIYLMNQWCFISHYSSTLLRYHCHIESMKIFKTQASLTLQDTHMLPT